MSYKRQEVSMSLHRQLTHQNTANYEVWWNCLSGRQIKQHAFRVPSLSSALMTVASDTTSSWRERFVSRRLQRKVSRPPTLQRKWPRSKRSLRDLQIRSEGPKTITVNRSKGPTKGLSKGLSIAQLSSYFNSPKSDPGICRSMCISWYI